MAIKGIYGALQLGFYSIFPELSERQYPVFSPHSQSTFWLISDAQLPDSLRVVHTNLAQASQFWTFWYSGLVGGAGRDYGRSTRHTVSVDETTTPYFLPTAVDRERGKRQEMRIPRHKDANNHDGNITFPPDWHRHIMTIST